MSSQNGRVRPRGEHHAPVALLVRATAIAALASGLALTSCVGPPKDTYWTRDNATEKQFRRISRRCNERAVLDVAKDRSSGSCGYSTESRGTVCRRVDPNDPFQVEQEKRRRERRMSYLYGECMQAAGWLPNYDGVGYKGRR